MRIKVSNYISAFLVEHGIDTMFTVTGGGAMHLNDAFGHQQGLSEPGKIPDPGTLLDERHSLRCDIHRLPVDPEYSAVQSDYHRGQRIPERTDLPAVVLGRPAAAREFRHRVCCDGTGSSLGIPEAEKGYPGCAVARSGPKVIYE